MAVTEAWQASLESRTGPCIVSWAVCVCVLGWGHADSFHLDLQQKLRWDPMAFQGRPEKLFNDSDAGVPRAWQGPGNERLTSTRGWLMPEVLQGLGCHQGWNVQPTPQQPRPPSWSRRARASPRSFQTLCGNGCFLFPQPADLFKCL